MRKGEIWLVKFIQETSVGHEYTKDRPALIIEDTSRIRVTTVATIMPLTSSQNQHQDDILARKNEKNRLYKDSLIKVHHILTFDKQRFIHRIGEVDRAIMNQIEKYLKKHFGLG